jgi:predicted N-acyltransferase
MHQNEIVATTYFFVDNKFGFHGVLFDHYEKLYKLCPIKFRTLFVCSPVSEYNMIHINESYSDHEDFIVASILREVESFARKSKIKLIVVRDQIKKYSSKYIDSKYSCVHFMPGTSIELGCDSFDDYLMGLKKKWRANIRNKINNKHPDLCVEIIPSAQLSPEENARCHGLYLQTMEKQRVKHEVLSKTYFEECANQFGDACTMVVAKHKQQIIGFAQVLENKESLVNVRMGMDYDVAKDYQLYYHLIYENIRYCINRGKKVLYTSQTCYRPKLEVGAKFVPLHTYFRFLNPALQRVGRKILHQNCRRYSELVTTDNPTDILAKYGLSKY